MAKKGTKLTEEQKQKMKEGRMASKNRKPAQIPMDRPILRVTGREMTGFDYWPAIRKCLRPLHHYMQCKEVEREIVDRQIWQNNGLILSILQKYFKVEIMEVKAKRTRAPSTRVLSEEHKKKMQEGRRRKKGMVDC